MSDIAEAEAVTAPVKTRKRGDGLLIFITWSTAGFSIGMAIMTLLWLDSSALPDASWQELLFG